MVKVMKVSGMSCQNCVRHVTEALDDIKGVTSVQVNLDAGEVRVEGESLNDDWLKESVEEAGYEVTGIQ